MFWTGFRKHLVNGMISLKSENELQILREANQIVARVLDRLAEMCHPGITTKRLDEECERIIEKYGAKPAFKGYEGFPNSLCISINEEIVHGIPSNRKLREGDIVSCDVGVIYHDYYGDSARTFAVGEISDQAGKLLEVTRESLFRGILKARVGNRLYDISHEIQSHVESHNLSVVRMFVGHGIGRNLHEPPQIPNYGRPGRGVRLKEGMVFALEPMVNIGHYGVKILGDGWTAVTEDGSLSAHFEHTVAVRNGMPDILSISKEDKVFWESILKHEMELENESQSVGKENLR